MPIERNPLPRLLRAWLITAVCDGLFSSVLVIVFYGSTFARLWQGVASVLLGPDALMGGERTVLIGLLMHFGVALGWTIVCFFVVLRLPLIQRLLATPFGVLKAASLYGPVIWMVMSLALIPLMTGNPPSISYRWWIQFFGHILFVALPMIWFLTRGIQSSSVQS